MLEPNWPPKALEESDFNRDFDSDIREFSAKLLVFIFLSSVLPLIRDGYQSMSTSTALAGWKRSHHCGELRDTNATDKVTLMGWVQKRRDHGSLVFVDLRDREGVTQIVFDPAQASGTCMEMAMQLRNEFVIAIRGVVCKRPEGMINDKLPTGSIEIQVNDAKILNRCEPLPFQVQEDVDAAETLRLKYRYLDLRRPNMRRNIMSRVAVVRAFRKALEARGFLDLETPFLYKSTPEGAREFLVPSRINPGQFYALPQSPQLFKQILMVAGFERYYQVVKCFRDEDLRADRQPEFTQIDCEMSFVEQDDVLKNFEESTAEVVKAVLGKTLPTPLRRMDFQEAMEKYGVDKPDTRFDLFLTDISDLCQSSGFRVFAEAISTGGIVNALRVPGAAERFSRKDLDHIGEIAKNHGGKGLAWIKVGDGKGVASWQAPIAKFFDDAWAEKLTQRLGLQAGDLVLFGAGAYDPTKASLGAVRLHLGQTLELIDPNRFDFLWIINFPMLEKDANSGRWVARHHPFTSPLPEDLQYLQSDPGRVRAAAYDLVLNGNEIAGGSIRIHDPEVQSQVFAAIGLSQEEAKHKFGFLLEALRLGAPPHGGIAFGLDRMVMILSGLTSIRDVIPFPKTHKGTCLMTDSPADAAIESLRDLHIRVQKLSLEEPSK